MPWITIQLVIYQYGEEQKLSAHNSLQILLQFHNSNTHPKRLKQVKWSPAILRKMFKSHLLGAFMHFFAQCLTLILSVLRVMGSQLGKTMTAPKRPKNNGLGESRFPTCPTKLNMSTLVDESRVICREEKKKTQLRHFKPSLFTMEACWQMIPFDNLQMPAPKKKWRFKKRL